MCLSGTKISGYNRSQFLYESLCDLDSQLKAVGSQLYIFNGSPAEIFTILHKEAGVTHLSFEQVGQDTMGYKDLGILLVKM